MKLFTAIMAISILAGILMVSVALASNPYVEASTKLDDIMSKSLGLAAFAPNILMTDEQLHITLSSTQMGDYPTPRMSEQSSSFIIRYIKGQSVRFDAIRPSIAFPELTDYFPVNHHIFNRSVILGLVAASLRASHSEHCITQKYQR